MREIVTYITAQEDGVIGEHTPVLISSRERPGQVIESFVTRVSSAVEVLPMRLWAGPANPSYGRAVVIAALPTMPLRPGELVSVRFLTQ